MIRFLLNRFVSGFLVIWGIVTVLFLIFSVLGDPTSVIRGQRSDIQTDDAIRKMFYLDQPVSLQYLNYLNDLSPLSLLNRENPNFESYSYVKLIGFGENRLLAFKAPYLRRSFQTNRKVSEILFDKIPGTILLAVSAMAFATLMGIILGVVASVSVNTWMDKGIVFVSLLGISAPSFFMGVLILWILAVYFGDWTGLHVTGYVFSKEVVDGEVLNVATWKNLLMPTIALGIRPLAIITQLTRSSMLEVNAMDYIRTARAKGLRERVVLFRHSLRNAMNPVVTSISSWFASLLAGAFFIEYIFGWQGIGKLTIDALGKNDYPVILGSALFIGIVFVLVNISVDILYAQLDPRVKIEG